MDKDVKTQVLERTHWAIKLARERYKDTRLNFVPDAIRLDLTGKTAGQFIVYRSKRVLRFNRVFLHHYNDDMITDTVPHEVAHLVVHDLQKQDPFARRETAHGPMWQSVMRLFGLSPRTCHNYDLSTVYDYVYACDCKDHFVSTRMHNSIQRGRSRHCLKCGQTLIYKRNHRCHSR